MSNNKWYVIVVIGVQTRIYGNARGQPFTSRENAQRAMTMRKLHAAQIIEIER